MIETIVALATIDALSGLCIGCIVAKIGIKAVVKDLHGRWF